VSYQAVIAVVVGTGVFTGILAFLARRLVAIEILRRHHEIGSAVFLQIGVIFAVLLAFVFNEVWTQYNTAANAINRECGNLRGAAILATGLPAPVRQQIIGKIDDYVHDIIELEWPAMRTGNANDVVTEAFKDLWIYVVTLDAREPTVATIRNQILPLLSDVHQNRATRIFEMVHKVPGLLWALLITLASVLVGFLLCFGVDSIKSQVMFTAIFTSSTTFVLVLVYLLDFPFAGALRIQPSDFQMTLHAIDWVTADK
jgi:hypothetical protein